MVEKYKHQLMRHLQHREYQPKDAEQLANLLNIPVEEQEEFKLALKQLEKDGQVVVGSAEAIGLPPIGHEITGKFRLNPKGFGFLIPDTPNAHGDLFIPAKGVNGALTNDLVRAEVRYDKGRRGRGRAKGGNHGMAPVVGRIIEIIKRGEGAYVGILKKRGTRFFVIPDGKAFTEHILIRDASACIGNHNKKVVVELTYYPQNGMSPEGVITKVLGDSGETEVETQAVIEAYGLPGEFPEAAVEEARNIVKNYNDPDQQEIYLKNRLDLRDTFTVTIDPPDAKDFDDAISIQKLDNGEWELVVHIADVATFVKQDQELDLEAKDRGNSCYLPRKVIPMLPEMLSNGICSLQPDVPRLTKTAFIRLDSSGHPLSSRFANGLIQSAHRMTYLEAQAVIDGDLEEAPKHARSENTYSPQLIQTLQWMNELAQLIRKRRMKQGMIVLGLPDAELVYDDEGKVCDAEPEDDAFTHTIIEMFMVEANEAAARVFSNLNIPIIRRIHPDPTSFDTDSLQAFANVAGFVIPQNPGRREIQQLLDAVRGKPAQLAVHFAVLKTLTKAEYAPLLIGHFALASEHYAHFTSPIRRYADLTLHRALDALFEIHGARPLPDHPGERKKLAAKLKEDPRCPSEEDLSSISSHISGTERNAEAAERELRTFLVLQLLVNHVGETWGGVVTGAASFGIFVQLDKYLVEGRIMLRDLPGHQDHWQFNKDIGAVVASRSGRKIGIGDRFDVIISGVDLVRRELSLVITEGAEFSKMEPMKLSQSQQPLPESKVSTPPWAQDQQQQEEREDRPRRRGRKSGGKTGYPKSQSGGGGKAQQKSRGGSAKIKKNKGTTPKHKRKRR